MNELKNESSPYLKQHALNPIHWRSWSVDHFKEAEKEGKLVFCSIGYSTCHWCHVMERESFEDSKVAQMLNENFISIKIDREEHPEVDALYMKSLQMLKQQGGWPLNIFLDPQARPFFGGTYFPKERFLFALQKIQELWKQDKSQIVSVGQQIEAHLKNTENAPEQKRAQKDFLENKLLEQILENYDHENGGSKGAPKFPHFYEMQWLLEHAKKNSSDKALYYATHSLDKICSGGIYDHVGGALHRYSTDENWFAPHFEKMLYDQASFVSALSLAYKVTNNDSYKYFLKQSIHYLMRDLKSPSGAFYSAEDADSEGIEGLFYVWEIPEIQKLLTESEFQKIKSRYKLERELRWEEGFILHLDSTKTLIAPSKEEESALKKLLDERSKRTRPLRDDKVLCSWNALIISALSKAATALQDPQILKKAEEAFKDLEEKLFKNSKLLKSWHAHDSHSFKEGNANLDDYAFLIDACLELLSSTGKLEFLRKAQELQSLQDDLFWDSKQGAYFFAPESAALLVRSKEFDDNVTPSGNSVSLNNLKRLYLLTGANSYQKRFDKLWSCYPPSLEKYPKLFPQALRALNWNSVLIVACKKLDTNTWRRIQEECAAEKAGSFVIPLEERSTEPKEELFKNKKRIAGKELSFYRCREGSCEAPY